MSLEKKTRGRVGVKLSQQFTFPFVALSVQFLLRLFPGVWYHGSVPSRLHLEHSSAESGAKEPGIVVDLQPNGRPDTLPALRVHGDSGKEAPSSSLSVLINPKDPDAVELRQLGDEHGEQGDGVDHKMDPIVLGVEAG